MQEQLEAIPWQKTLSKTRENILEQNNISTKKDKFGLETLKQELEQPNHGEKLRCFQPWKYEKERNGLGVTTSWR